MPCHPIQALAYLSCLPMSSKLKLLWAAACVCLSLSFFRKSLALACACLVIVSLAGHARADGPLRFKTPAQCTTEGGSKVDIAPGRYIPEPEWQHLDRLYTGLENDVTRLTAENNSYKESGSGVSWYQIAAALTAGFGLGYYLNQRE